MISMNLKAIGGFLVMALMIFCPMTVSAQPELIAVAADGQSADAAISDVAARAPYFLIFNADGTLAKAHPNPVGTDRQAGPALAAWLSKNQVRILIAERIGPNLARGLEAHAIQGLTMNGLASEAVTAVRQ